MKPLQGRHHVKLAWSTITCSGYSFCIAASSSPENMSWTDPGLHCKTRASRCSSVRLTISKSHFIAGRNRVESRASHFCNHWSSHPNTKALTSQCNQTSQLIEWLCLTLSGELFVLHWQICTGMVVRARHGRPRAKQGSKWC